MIKARTPLLVAFVLLAPTACGGTIRKVLGLGPPAPPVEHYRLVLPVRTTPPDTARVRLLPGRLAIAPYVTRGLYASHGIVFRVNDVRLDAYANREWAIPLRDMLGEATETVLEAVPLTSERAVFDPRSPGSFDYQWRGTVIEFEEVNRNAEVLAAVHLEADLIRMSNDSVVWSGAERIERAVAAPTDSMYRVVETLSTLTAEVITRLVQRAQAEVPAPVIPVIPTAAAAPPPR